MHYRDETRAKHSTGKQLRLQRQLQIAQRLMTGGHAGALGTLGTLGGGASVQQQQHASLRTPGNNGGAPTMERQYSAGSGGFPASLLGGSHRALGDIFTPTAIDDYVTDDALRCVQELYESVDAPESDGGSSVGDGDGAGDLDLAGVAVALGGGSSGLGKR